MLRRDRSYPRSTRLVCIDQHGGETTLMTFKNDGTFCRHKDMYVRGLISDDFGKLKETT